MAKSIKSEINSYKDLESLSKAAAKEIVETACAAVTEKNRFFLALAGGNTPRALYSLLASRYADNIPWSSTHIFWGDERYVPKDHPDSNYKMAYQTLISKLSLPPQNIHSIPTEMENPEKAASSYEQQLRRFFQISKAGKNPATFDLILLGVGEDGHTASLFPEAPALKEKERWVAAVLAPSTYRIRQRITLTLPLINRAKKVFYLVSGSKKKAVVNAILEDPEAASKHYPAAMVRPEYKLVWFVDKEVL